MRSGELIHTIIFYKSNYSSNEDGTGHTELVEIRKVKCKIDDITYKTISDRKKEDIKEMLKVYTYFFKEYDMKGLKAKINNKETVYDVIHRENVKYKNIELIFTLEG